MKRGEKEGERRNSYHLGRRNGGKGGGKIERLEDMKVELLWEEE